MSDEFRPEFGDPFTAPMFVTHVTKYGRFVPGVLGPVTGIQHHAVGVGTGTCRVCRRIVVRGAGRWWE